MYRLSTQNSSRQPTRIDPAANPHRTAGRTETRHAKPRTAEFPDVHWFIAGRRRIVNRRTPDIVFPGAPR
ncbi:hypothetical protein [Nocardia beijingensis]|uniref:Uncharacterized protein n=1 Tax=Nocardia beijingensis TaxID=95162 RepID=A0ABW7W9C2_9NOCA